MWSFTFHTSVLFGALTTFILLTRTNGGYLGFLLLLKQLRGTLFAELVITGKMQTAGTGLVPNVRSDRKTQRSPLGNPQW